MLFDLTTPLIKLFLAESRDIFNNLHKLPCGTTDSEYYCKNFCDSAENSVYWVLHYRSSTGSIKYN